MPTAKEVLASLPSRKKKQDRKNKNRKYGRNKKWCELYRAMDRRRLNKIVKMERRLRKNPNDVGAAVALERLKGL